MWDAYNSLVEGWGIGSKPFKGNKFLGFFRVVKPLAIKTAETISFLETKTPLGTINMCAL